MELDSDLLPLSQDDSLIQLQTPHSQKSPYRPPRISPAKGFNVRKDPVPRKLNSLSHEDVTNKENITTSRTEVPKLRVEPMQMKKKKGGGYNLRKSLAWNQAFFTEEGVLDPIELSMITGTLGRSSKESLPAITEEATTSISSDNQCNLDSANTRTPHKNLLKASPAASSGKGRGTVRLPMKHTSPAGIRQASTSMASHIVLSTHGARTTATRVGSSPRSLPLSTSYPNTASIIVQKAVAKESKLPKFPVPKPEHPSVPAANKRSTGGPTSLKQNQMLRPVVNTQRNTEVKSCAKSVKNTRKIKAKAVAEELPNRSSASYAKRNKNNPPVNLLAPTQLCPIHVDKVNSSGSKMLSDDVPPIITVDSSDSQVVTTQQAVTLSSKNGITGRTLQHTQSQSTKPSGLRMPSPSLGFFGQSKVPASSCFSQRSVNPNHRFGKVSDVRPPPLVGKIPEIVDGNKLGLNVASSRYDLSAVSIDANKSGVGKDAMVDGKKIIHELDNCELERAKNTLLGITGANEKFEKYTKDESNILVDEDGEAGMEENIDCLKTPSCRCLTEVSNANSCSLGHKAGRESSGSYLDHSCLLYRQDPAQFDINVTGTRTNLGNSCEDEKSGNPTVTDFIKDGMVNSASVRRMQYLDQLSGLHSDRLETSNFEELLVRYTDKPSMLDERNPKNIGRDFELCRSEKIDNQTREALELTNFKLQNSELSSRHICASQSKDSLIRNEITEITQSPKQSLDVVELKDTSAMLLWTQSASVEFEQSSKSIHLLSTADCLLLEKDTGLEEYEVGANTIFLVDEKGTIDMDTSGVETAETFGGMEGEGFDTNQMTKQGFVAEPASVSFEVAPLVSNHDSGLDTNVTDVTSSDRATSLGTHPYSSEVSEFLFGEVDELFYPEKMENSEVSERNVFMEPAYQSMFSSSSPESHGAETNHTPSYSEREVCHQEQKYDLEITAETDNSLDGYRGIGIVQTREAGIEAANTGDEPELFADSSVPPKSCIEQTSIVCNQSAVGAHCSEESEQGAHCSEESGQSVLPNCFTLVEEVSGYNNTLDSFSKETAESAKSNGSNVLGSRDTVTIECEPCESEFRSFEENKGGPLSPIQAHVCGDHGDKFNGNFRFEETKSTGTENEPSSEKYDLSAISQTRQNIGYLTLPSSINQSVGVTNCALTDDNKPEVCQDMDSHVKDTKSDLPTFLCQELDGDTTAAIDSKKPVSTSDKTNLMIFPPSNAVPFSDEWLAAFEAAGEEILTVKSGAVQNSPPDKSVPEPSPWSPVKRKSNAIGPYDCTKFTNNLSSDS